MKYTINNAVTDTLESIPYDTTFSFRDLYKGVLINLHINGNPACPMDSSVSRSFRKYKRGFDVVIVSHSKSLWIRKRENR